VDNGGGVSVEVDAEICVELVLLSLDICIVLLVTLGANWGDVDDVCCSDVDDSCWPDVADTAGVAPVVLESDGV
jgi:hypothetical protein